MPTDRLEASTYIVDAFCYMYVRAAGPGRQKQWTSPVPLDWGLNASPASNALTMTCLSHSGTASIVGFSAALRADEGLRHPCTPNCGVCVYPHKSHRWQDSRLEFHRLLKTGSSRHEATEDRGQACAPAWRHDRPEHSVGRDTKLRGRRVIHPPRQRLSDAVYEVWRAHVCPQMLESVCLFLPKSRASSQPAISPVARQGPYPDGCCHAQVDMGDKPQTQRLPQTDRLGHGLPP